VKLQPTGKFDNSAKAFAHITVTPLAAAMGAEIGGVDLARLTDAQAGEIKQALWRHKMIFFRDQRISHAQQEAFTLRFGEFGTDAYTTGLPGHPNVQPVIKEAETRVKMVFGEGWHTDSPFLARPPAISILYGVDVPPYGGDTIWCNTALAYDYLSDTMKAMITPLKVHMSAIGVLTTIDAINEENAGAGKASKRSAFGDMELDMERRAMIAGSYHPLVRTHPETGKKALYVDETYSQGIQGMTLEESRALLGFLIAHITQASFQCRLRWSNDTFVMWDNRSCIHHAFNDYDGYRREMYRTTVLGEVPA
jgi:taurine dioxygenase